MVMLTEKELIWERLAGERRPVLLYGMGNGAEKILFQCRRYGIEIQDVFASDEYVRGHSFAGYPVLRYDDICEKYTNALVLLGFAVFQPDMFKRLEQMEKRYEILAPDVPLFGGDIFTLDSLTHYREELERVYHLLADEQSRKVFRMLLEYKISGKIHWLRQMETPREEIFQGFFPVSEGEAYVDLGAYDGDTIEEFISLCGGRYDRITALEPDRRNFKKLEKKIRENQWRQVRLYSCGAWSEDGFLPFEGKGGRSSSISFDSDSAGYSKQKNVEMRCVDTILRDEKATWIKMDVEGAEREAIFGCRHTLKKYSPKLMISVYHRTNDFFTLPLLLHHMQPDYRFYLRHHPYIPAWETNLYAVP